MSIEARTTEARTTEARTTEAWTTEARTTEARTTEARTTEAPAEPLAPRRVVFPSLQNPGDAEGFTRGHAAGYAAGLRKAEAEVRTRRAECEAERAAALEEGRHRIERGVAVLEAAARALHQRTAPVLAEAETELAAAALAIAGAVLGRELSDAEVGAKAALARAFSGPDSAPVVAVRLHPSDLALVAGAAPAGVDLVADPGLEPGDAVADYPDGELDARISTALARAAAALAGEEA
ncbi:FliH/SctL family protein [Sinomonas susongensis]|uniref:FliH/SctL family protein n=1 Tax=Sinomonas susongensis TaxID=1324851 RepID=UPI0011099420|nr:FliH/SctL family protein [Sinomonas susongensis]